MRSRDPGLPPAPRLLPGSRRPQRSPRRASTRKKGPGDDVDIFRFEWSGGTLTIDTFGSSFDTILFLFDGSGIGVVANDDAPGAGGLSEVSPNLSAGEYLIALANCCRMPTSSAGQIWNDFCCGGEPTPNGPGQASPLNGWNDAGAPFTPSAANEPYVINFSAATVPEPGTFTALVVGLIGLAIHGKQRPRR